MRNRWRVSIGFIIIAALVGIGVVPVRKGLTVRYQAAVAARSARGQKRRPGRSRRRRGWLSGLLRRR
jgi:hypothetical protein